VPPRTETGGKRKRPPPTRTQKQATVWAAEQNLRPWEVASARPKPPGKRVEPPKSEALDHRYRVALAAPVSPRARQRLADTMSKERKREYVQTYRPPPPPRRDSDGFLHALTSTPGSVAHTLGEVGGAVGRAAKYRTTHEPSLGEVAHGLRVAGQVAGLGDIRRFAHPWEALTADLATRAANEREFTRWRRQHPEANIEEFLGTKRPTAAILPWFGPLRGGAELGRAVVDVAEASHAAPGLPRPPAVEAAPFEQRIGEALKAAKGEREQMAAGHSLERGARFAAQQDTYRKLVAAGVDEETAHLVAKRELAGELPKIESKAFKVFSAAERQKMIGKIYDHPGWQPGQITRAADAIHNAARGIVPQPTQIKLLEEVLTPAEAKQITKAAKQKQGWLKRGYYEVGGIPRTLQTTADVSQLFRQQLTLLTGHPTVWAKNLGVTPKAWRGKGYDEIAAEINRDPLFLSGEYDHVGLDITELTGDLSKREENIPSVLATKLPVVKQTARSYTASNTMARVRLYNLLRQSVIDAAEEGKGVLQMPGRRGKPRDVEKALKSLARYVNTTTGRGHGGQKFEQSAGALSVLLFSPRLLKSRFDFLLNPLFYAQLDPVVRMRALRTAAQTLAAGVVVLGAASQIPGVTVSRNPLSANFGRIRIGDTRIDIFGGFQPIVRLYAQLLTGAYVSSVTGLAMDLKSGGYGKSTRWDILMNFLRSKLAPNVSLVADYLDQQNLVGDKFQWRDQWQRVTPMILSDMIDAYRLTDRAHSPEEAAGAAAGAWLLNALGLGVNTYSGRPSSRSTVPPPSPGLIGGGEGGGLFGGGGGGLFGP
jgi:hypothetical protein